jgi:hypothetical protein
LNGSPVPSIPWQRPNATEAFAAEQLEGVAGYLPFAWATCIDRLRCGVGPPPDPPPQERFLGAGAIRATVCQHIWALDHLKLFTAAGITDLFWSHATNGLLGVNGLRIHPFPLYPVRCATHPTSVPLLPPADRSLLYSFQGAYAPGLYLSPVREWILQWPPRPDAELQRRDEWHYEQAVYREQVYGQPPNQDRAAQLAAEATAYANTLQHSVFALCPSGSGPNSIRLWEALGYGAIPVILADHLWLPGDAELWQQAALFVPETQEAVAALPDRLEALAADPSRLQAMQAAGQQLWQRYGLPGFAVDVRAFLRDPMAVLSARARQQLPDDPLEVAATSPGELPLRVRRSLLTAEPYRAVLIRIDDDAPADHLQIRWQAALRICEPLLGDRQWRVVSLSPGMEQGAP